MGNAYTCHRVQNHCNGSVTTHFLAMSPCGTRLGLSVRSTLPRGIAMSLLSPDQQFIHAYSLPGPRDTSMCPTSCLQLWNKAICTGHGPGSRAKKAPWPSLLLRKESGEGTFPLRLGRGQLPRCPVLLLVMPAWELEAPGIGGEGASSVPASLPSLLADAVHVCPTRSSPPHPQHFPKLPWQQLRGPGSPGQRL